jgi:integrase
MAITIREMRPGVHRLHFKRTNQREAYRTVRGTRADAEKAAAIWAAELDHRGGAAPFGPSTTLARVIRDQLALRSYAPGTREYYDRILRLYIDPEPPETARERREWGAVAYSFNVGRKQVGRVSAQDGLDFQHHLIERFSGSAHNGARSINEAVRLCMAALDYCVRLGVITANPWAEIARVRPRPASVRVPKSRGEVAAIQMIPGRAGLLLRLALATSARRGELLALTWRVVDLDAGRLHIEHSLDDSTGTLRLVSPKSNAGRRSLDLPAPIVAELARVRAAAAETALASGRRLAEMPVLPGDDGGWWPPANASQACRRALHDAGIPTSLHALRHLSASLLLAAGINPEAVRRRLGHASVRTTLGFYAHTMVGDEANCATTLTVAMGTNKASA